MTNRLISGRIQLLHHTEYEWSKIGDIFIPEDGEACLTLDDENLTRVKFGDGLRTWNEIDYIDNHVTFDGLSVAQIGSLVTLKGFDEASKFQAPRKSRDGKLEWYTPSDTVVLALGDSETIVEQDETGLTTIPKATIGTLGLVKGSDEITVLEDGSLEVGTISIAKVQGLQDKLDELVVATAASVINQDQFVVINGVLNVKEVQASKVVYEETTLEETLETLTKSTMWELFQ